jgi:hypothetical protein
MNSARVRSEGSDEDDNPREKKGGRTETDYSIGNTKGAELAAQQLKLKWLVAEAEKLETQERNLLKDVIDVRSKINSAQDQVVNLEAQWGANDIDEGTYPPHKQPHAPGRLAAAAWRELALSRQSSRSGPLFARKYHP